MRRKKEPTVSYRMSVFKSHEIIVKPVDLNSTMVLNKVKNSMQIYV